MLPRLLACLALALLVATPAASAFAGARQPMDVAFGREDAPTLIAAGSFALDAGFEGGFFATDPERMRLGAVPRLTVVELTGMGPRNTTFEDVSLVVEAGTFVWRGALQGTLGADYGFALALPTLPVAGMGEGVGEGGLLLVGPRVAGALSSTPAGSDLQVVDGRVSLVRPDGKYVDGWAHRPVNEGATLGATPRAGQVLFHLEGRFAADFAGPVAGGIVGAADADLTLQPAEVERFTETLDALDGVSRALGMQGGLVGADSPLRRLEALAPTLNGAVFLLPRDGQDELAPRTATHGDASFEPGPFLLLRAEESTLGWSDGSMRVQSTPTLALMRNGFAIEEPMRVGFVPIASLLLWAVAFGAIVYFFVRRPAQAQPVLTIRALGWVVQGLALVAAFYLWDQSFAASFGTSFLREVESGAGVEDASRLGFLLALELAPWTIAALFFALPMRIALGVGLRYAGKGKSFKGFAKAGGYLVLGLVGPAYALWLFNVVLTHVLGRV